MKLPPQSPAELTRALLSIFPSLPRDFGSSGESVFAEAGPTFHSLMREFVYHFRKHADEFSDRQLRRLAELVVRSRAAPGPLSSAMDTCFLEPARELKFSGRLDPFLAAAEDAAGNGGRTTPP